GAWDNYQRLVNTELTDEKNLACAQSLMGSVNLLSNQNQVMSQHLAQATAALAGIPKTFETMSGDLEAASREMGSVDDFARKSLHVRQALLKRYVVKAVQDYRDTITAAREFLATDSNCQTEGITPDVTPPRVN
ncbi:hypothetical protein FSARC_10016, partial [Fusarium sarcochroum]